ncbi:MAG: rhomboid family intramembrane serine protease [Bacteroidales bacterium]|nr:rhomboid family intramembrane serine protease [Bacteroidales bacterium]
MNLEKRKFIHSLVFPAIFLLLLWLIKLSEIVFSVDLAFLGIYPLKARGLTGILFSPLLHGDIPHLATNSAPLLVLGVMLFYFYRKIAYNVFFLIYLLGGLWVWFGAREAFHIGASGLIYGLASFLFFSGWIRKDVRLSALSLVVVFVYGSMVWGIFPNFNPKPDISWESHLYGFISGLILAFYFKKFGPQPKRYTWEEEEEEDEENDPGESGNIPFNYHYKKTNDP